VRTITDTLRARFGSRVGEQPSGAATTGTSNSAALDLYLVGQALLKRRGSGVPQSIVTFERAIALDPKFARAYAGLATALQLIPFFVGSPPDEVRDRTLNAARRALELDSTLADAHVALGSIYHLSAQWRASDAELQRALTLEPNSVAARLAYARFLIIRGRSADAVDQLQRARKLERVSPLISGWLSYGFFATGHPDSALAESEKAIQLDSTLLATTNFGSLVNLALGRPDVARRLMAAATPAVGVMTNAPYVYAKLGDTITANRLLKAMDSNTPRPWFTEVARASVRLAIGDSAGALSALEKSARETGSLWINFISLTDPAFDLVRRSPRFAALLRQADVNVPELTSSHARRNSILPP
jgi:tetratricopeptide (TPR) repeat protein